ncbi:MAG: hypothetical protein K8U57_27580 [Planctomycetes bacterium]|nr:hypothetical protein [Planctomycetota bacterium]
MTRPVFFLQETADGSRFWDGKLHPGNVLMEVTRRKPFAQVASEEPKNIRDQA